MKLRNGGSLEQVPQTWAYIWSEMPGLLFSDSYVNEWGVTVASDNCPSREDRPELTDGGIGYMLRRLVAERAKTAREGVLLAGELVERFGYIDSGRTYIIADPNEGWLFVRRQRQALAGPAGAGRRGGHGGQHVHGPRGRICKTKPISWPRRTSWTMRNPEAGTIRRRMDHSISPRSTPIRRRPPIPNNIGRQWSGLTCVARDDARTPGPNLPFSVVPKHKLSVLDAMQILRHDKENESGPAPADSPFVCALCSGATQTSFVAQLRREMPLDIGIVYWVCLASPRTSFYIPFHFGIGDFPAGFRLQSQQADSGGLRPQGAGAVCRESAGGVLDVLQFPRQDGSPRPGRR